MAENEYQLNNQRVEFQEIEAAVLECEQEVIVKIADDHASRKAYKGLVDLLDDLGGPTVPQHQNARKVVPDSLTGHSDHSDFRR